MGSSEPGFSTLLHPVVDGIEPHQSDNNEIDRDDKVQKSRHDQNEDAGDKGNTARDFFNAMLQRYPNRRLGATTLWAGTSTLYALRDRHSGEVFHDSITGWFK